MRTWTGMQGVQSQYTSVRMCVISCAHTCAVQSRGRFEKHKTFNVARSPSFSVSDFYSNTHTHSLSTIWHSLMVTFVHLCAHTHFHMHVDMNTRSLLKAGGACALPAAGDVMRSEQWRRPAYKHRKWSPDPRPAHARRPTHTVSNTSLTLRLHSVCQTSTCVSFSPSSTFYPVYIPLYVYTMCMIFCSLTVSLFFLIIWHNLCHDHIHMCPHCKFLYICSLPVIVLTHFSL